MRKGVMQMASKLSKTMAKGTAKVLSVFLSTDANAASCYIMYQPKAPKELSKFRKNYGK